MGTLQLYYPIKWRAFSTIYSLLSIHLFDHQSRMCRYYVGKRVSINISGSRSLLMILLSLWRRTWYKMLNYYISSTLWFHFFIRFDSILSILVQQRTRNFNEMKKRREKYEKHGIVCSIIFHSCVVINYVNYTWSLYVSLLGWNSMIVWYGVV